MDPITQLDEIIPRLNDLVAGLDDEQLSASTPCSDFDVAGVLRHMVGGGTMFAAAFRGEQPPAGDPPADLLAAFPVVMADLGAAVRTPGALERTISAPFGDVPGDVFARFVALDGLIHGWDIATATGKAYDPPAAVVEAVDGFARNAITDGVRKSGVFKAATEAPAGAAPLDGLVAFTGRTLPG